MKNSHLQVGVAAAFVSALTGMATAQTTQETPHPILTFQGQDFYSWEAVQAAGVVEQFDLRCNTVHDDTSESIPADCSGSSTTIKPQYDPSNGLFEIPTVVHVISNTNGTGNISDAQVRSQIDILNEDFLALAGSNGANGTNGAIQFYLADVDPNGAPTNGITRTVNNSWFNDSGNYRGALNWDPNRYLNIYVNSAGGFLGYASLPFSGAGGSQDGVTCLWSAFGRNAPFNPYHQGRTATHEVGHYFGLYHTFQSGCGIASAPGCYTSGDRICDTNPDGTSHFGCPGNATTCGGQPSPVENYMEYTDDLCMEEFTPEQINRMRCAIESYRPNLPRSPGGGCGQPGVANFTNGTGVNPSCFASTTNPVIGQPWVMTVDASGVAGAVSTTAQAFKRSAVISTSAGELLLDRTSRELFTLVSTGTGTNTHSITVPPDPEIIGFTLNIQGFVNGSSGVLQYCNAYSATVGCQ